ncbi:hypothetical protein [Sulfuricystis multivorans]|uniref:hypothetical protein n=1 Tax=Sulfuricystis multivorans TaxID=2211108 RepID=UPI000F833C63|nr:hypothetical protein [Sulfuricystis multivorans]
MNRPTPQLIRMKKWMRKSTINFFERNKDAIAAPSFVPLCNQMIVDIMSTGFEVISRDTYFITCRSRQILSYNLKGKVFREDEIFAAERAMDEHFERLHEYFDTRIDQGEKKLVMAGFNPSEMQRLVNNYETMTVTNGVTQYLDILAKADYYITILHYLWVTSELSDNPDEARRVKLNTEREVRHHLYGIVRASNTHYNNIRRLCNGVVEKRRQERLAQAERDRQKAAEKEAKRLAAAKQRQSEQRKKRLANQQQNLSAVQSEMDNLSSPAVAAA